MSPKGFGDRLPAALMAAGLMELAALMLPAADSPPSFNHDVGPVLHRNCTPCHRPGAAGPFPLLTYEDARSRAAKVAELVSKRRMPPWMPAPGHGEFENERRLDDADIASLRAWAAAGAPEGRPEDRRSPPQFSSEWQFGPPDLTIELRESFPLAAAGNDVYRNFVVPFPAGTNRFVRAFEFRPESAAVHHARILFDATGESRRRDAADPVCGFPGTMPPARLPSGHLLGWVLGRQPTLSPPDLPWPLDGQGDLILQLHLRPTGKPEKIHPRLGLYFTNQPPRRQAVLLGLVAQTLDIAAGDSRYEVRRSLELPVDAELLSVMPHAHYLGREVELTVLTPGGDRRSLLLIPEWNFDWQDDYRYRQPITLARGTRIEMRWRFDNSAANPHNPSTPPRRVLHGPASTDEMAELWLQLVPHDERDADVLRRLSRELSSREIVADFTERLKREPDNAAFRLERAKSLGALGRQEEGFAELLRALELKPDLAEAHHYIGVIYFERGLLADARAALTEAARLDANSARTQIALGLVAEALKEFDVAEKHFVRAVELNPGDESAKARLARIRKAP
jgi:mono/diheme cytochrome c family protein